MDFGESIENIETLQRYLNGVLNRADHHAGNIEGVSFALLGAIVWKSDRKIEVREYNGSPANMIWFWVDGNKYAMSYNHSTTYQEIITIFNDL